MKLFKMTKDVLKADFVSLHWIDINSNSAWLSLKDAKSSKATICISNGWLIRADKELHILAADMNFNDDGTLGDVGGITTIPTTNVLRIKKVKL
jgi:hypothetical protein